MDGSRFRENHLEKSHGEIMKHQKPEIEGRGKYRKGKLICARSIFPLLRSPRERGENRGRETENLHLGL